MNLNTIKRGFSRTNPERGLRSLPGAQKSERRDEHSGIIRVSGTYIPTKHDKSGLILGMMAYVTGWTCSGILICRLILSALPFTQNIDWSDFGLTAYVILAFIMHIFVIVADGITNSNAPWARKSLIVFWGGLALFFALLFPISMLKSFL